MVSWAGKRDLRRGYTHYTIRHAVVIVNEVVIIIKQKKEKLSLICISIIDVFFKDFVLIWLREMKKQFHFFPQHKIKLYFMSALSSDHAHVDTLYTFPSISKAIATTRLNALNTLQGHQDAFSADRFFYSSQDSNRCQFQTTSPQLNHSRATISYLPI